MVKSLKIKNLEEKSVSKVHYTCRGGILTVGLCIFSSDEACEWKLCERELVEEIAKTVKGIVE